MPRSARSHRHRHHASSCCPERLKNKSDPSYTNIIACAILCMLFFACAPASAFAPKPTLPTTTPDRAQSDTDALSAALADYMGCFHLELMGLEKQQLAITSKIFCLTEVYAEENPQPCWVSPAGPGPKARVVLDFLKTAEEDGLDPENYEIEEISALFRARTAQNLAMLDTLLTYNLIKYIHDVHYGRIKQPHADVRQFPRAKSIEFKPREAFVKAMAAPDLSVYLEGLPPAHEHYAGLKKALAWYREIQKEGGWPSVAPGPTIRPGDDDERIPAIIKRLAVTGDLDPDVDHEDPPAQYSPQLVPSIARFQSRHGLASDGAIGEQTIAAMNVSVDERVRQIIINMTRWRWQDHVLGEKYILVNIAGFNLSAFEADKEAFSFPVIVGKLKHQTPVFSDRISSIEINPYWNIPEQNRPRGRAAGPQERPAVFAEAQHPAFSGLERRCARDRLDLYRLAHGQPGHDEQVSPEAGPRPKERARPDKVRFPQYIQRVSARHARAGFVCAQHARFQPRLHPGERSGAAGRLRACRRGRRMDAGNNQKRH